MKNQRQARILEIVSKVDVKTQEEITAILQEEGFKVTQATVSRDLKDLKLTKNMSSSGFYRYSVSRGHEHVGMVKLNNAMVESIVDVKYSMNNVVIKTFPGMAQAVGLTIDKISDADILGCVAGDDTIIIVTPDKDKAYFIAERMKKLFGIK